MNVLQKVNLSIYLNVKVSPEADLWPKTPRTVTTGLGLHPHPAAFNAHISQLETGRSLIRLEQIAELAPDVLPERVKRIIVSG
ncbi:MAG: hypothetical protein V1930_08895 [Pseudomonadota bacterium]